MSVPSETHRPPDIADHLPPPKRTKHDDTAPAAPPITIPLIPPMTVPPKRTKHDDTAPAAPPITIPPIPPMTVPPKGIEGEEKVKETEAKEIGGGVGGELDRLFAVQDELAAVNDAFLYTRFACDPDDQRALIHEYEKLLRVRLEAKPASAQTLRARLVKEFECHRQKFAKVQNASYWFGLAELEDSTQDYENAFIHFYLAANLGSGDARNYLGYYFGKGLGTAIDLAERVRWYRLAAVLNKNPVAHRNMGLTYEQGIGVPIDEKAAAEWFRKGTNLGDTGSMYCLGILHLEGRGVRQDTDLAISLLTKAAEDPEAPDQDAANKLASWYYARADKTLAKHFATIGANSGVPESSYILGRLADDAGDLWDAFHFYRAAAHHPTKEDRPQEAFYRIGLAYLQGRGVTENEFKAFCYWSQVQELALRRNPEEFKKLTKHFADTKPPDPTQPESESDLEKFANAYDPSDSGSDSATDSANDNDHDDEEKGHADEKGQGQDEKGRGDRSGRQQDGADDGGEADDSGPNQDERTGEDDGGEGGGGEGDGDALVGDRDGGDGDGEGEGGVIN